MVHGFVGDIKKELKIKLPFIFSLKCLQMAEIFYVETADLFAANLIKPNFKCLQF